MTITHGYCTLAEAKSRLGISDSTDDTILESVIEAVSRWIENWTGRMFYVTQETRTFTARYDDWLSIDDITPSGSAGYGITTLKTDDYGTRTWSNTWASTDYELLPSSGSQLGKPYTHIELSFRGEKEFPIGIKNAVQIAGYFGYGYSVPAPVKEACLLLVERLFKRKDAPSGQSGQGEWAQSFIKNDPDIVALLEPYRRLEIY